LEGLDEKKAAQRPLVHGGYFQGRLSRNERSRVQRDDLLLGVGVDKNLASAPRPKNFSATCSLTRKNCTRTQARIDYFATSLPTMLIFEDDIQFRQDTTAIFLQAQARLGLGSKGKSPVVTANRAAPGSKSCAGG